MTPADRTRLRALATDALRGGYDYEAHEQPYVNLAGCVCTTPATMIALLTALDAAERVVEDVKLFRREHRPECDWFDESMSAYDAATAAKEGK